MKKLNEILCAGISLEDASRILGVAAHRVRRWAREGLIATVPSPTGPRLPARAVEWGAQQGILLHLLRNDMRRVMRPELPLRLSLAYSPPAFGRGQ